MKFQQIRSATVKITYGGKTFLADPWLGKQNMTGCFALMPLIIALNSRGDARKKPIIDHCRTWRAADPAHVFKMCPACPLPMSLREINSGVDAYLVTHAHLDHIGLGINGKGCEGMVKTIPCYAPSRQDADFLEYSGMKDVRVIESKVDFDGFELIKVYARHGTEKPCGDASGYVFRGAGEKTLYLCGDTVWCPEVKLTIEKYHPDVIITNNCAAVLKDYGRLIMDDNDLNEVCKAAPEAVVIASHMDNVPHATITRETLKIRLAARGLRNRVLIPDDGESYTF